MNYQATTSMIFFHLAYLHCMLLFLYILFFKNVIGEAFLFHIRDEQGIERRQRILLLYQELSSEQTQGLLARLCNLSWMSLDETLQQNRELQVLKRAPELSCFCLSPQVGDDFVISQSHNYCLYKNSYSKLTRYFSSI